MPSQSVILTAQFALPRQLSATPTLYEIHPQHLTQVPPTAANSTGRPHSAWESISLYSVQICWPLEPFLLVSCVFLNVHLSLFWAQVVVACILRAAQNISMWSSKGPRKHRPSMLMPALFYLLSLLMPWKLTAFIVVAAAASEKTHLRDLGGRSSKLSPKA